MISNVKRLVSFEKKSESSVMRECLEYFEKVLNCRSIGPIARLLAQFSSSIESIYLGNAIILYLFSHLVSLVLFDSSSFQVITSSHLWHFRRKILFCVFPYV